MKVIVSGSSKVIDYSMVESAIKKSGFYVTEVVNGHFDGTDSIAELWAKQNSLPFRLFSDQEIATSQTLSEETLKSMIDYADAVIFLWDNSGTGDYRLIDQMESAGKKVYVYMIGSSINGEVRYDNRLW